MDNDTSEACDTDTNSDKQFAEADVIEPINRSTVHRICSGQVVLSLAIAVKELVENAVDALATSIEVRLKDYGSELIEVSDNGIGVRRENFQALTLKHYTSKLRKFDDLESIGTLGFRGEALSSLCALSELTIITRHASAEHGTKIQYDLGGKILTELPAARELGTTVSIENLFSTLPVRRKEFTKNLKKEYSKMCQMLYAYCLVSKGIKFTCTNQTKAGSRCIVVSTEGSNSIRENIISIFGPKQVSSLVELEMVEPEKHILDEYKVNVVPGEQLPFTFESIVSSAAHGNGRSTSDRQFFYINSRPCEPNKIMKLANEVYRQFNSNQYPFVFLNITMERSLVDVNVTPDKRQIFLDKEKLLLAVLKSSLLECFKNCPSTFLVQNLNIANNRRTNDDANTSQHVRGIKRMLNNTKCKSESNVTKEGNIVDLFKKCTKSDSSLSATPQKKNSPAVKQTSLMDNKNFNITVGRESSDSHADQDVTETQSGENLKELISIACKLQKQSDKEMTVDSDCIIESSQPDASQIPCSDEIRAIDSENLKTEELDLGSQLNTISEDVAASPPNKKLCTSLFQETVNVDDTHIEQPKISNEKKVIEPLIHDTIIKNKNNEKPPKKTVTIRSSMQYIQEAVKRCHAKQEKETIKVRFRSEITPAANKSAEQELQKQISKDMFKEMDIIGQFNLGFIIAKLQNDLFIIDQHATDEKYNFEQLQLSTVLESQVLVNPKPLQLTAANEDLLIENIELFHKNGFSFQIKHEAPATKKVSLTAIPISKNCVFGKEDIEEMLFMLQEDVNHITCRPSRVRAMFASRACRKSVMVGCPLSQTDMRRLVDHMGEIEQPWNCPHGRPTMRHLVNLKLLQNS